MFRTLKTYRRETVLVAAHDGTTYHGMLEREAKDGIVLLSPSIETVAGDRIQAGGLVFIPAQNVRFVQLRLPIAQER